MHNDVAALFTDDTSRKKQFAQQGFGFKSFADRYKIYLQRRQELEADPEAPHGFASFFARSATKVGLKLAKGIPVGGELVDLVDTEALATQAGNWAEFVGKKLRNNIDEVRLVQKPIEVLTPLFLTDLGKIPSDQSIIMMFDTYERTRPWLDDWLLDLLKGSYGSLPPQTLFVISGRDELDRNAWNPFENVLRRLSLEPFTEREARAYLSAKNITDENVVNVILRLSGGLPLLVALLATEKPTDPQQVDDPSETAVERFLIWTDDLKQRKIAINAALPRRFNRDVLKALVGEEDVQPLFEWLKQAPFVEERSDGWIYHQVVRDQMLRYKRRESLQEWSVVHARLAEFFQPSLPMWMRHLPANSLV